MLSTPEHGWCDITIGDWTERCSYVYDVPYELLESVDYTNRTGRTCSVKFNAEGWEYIIVFDVFETHIITCDFNAKWCHHVVDINIKDIIRELLTDIRRDLDAWGKWGIGRSEYEIEERELDLQAWCKFIEKRL